MAKVRIYEIAKNLNIKGRDISLLLEEYGSKKKNHMSSLSNEELNIILEYYTQQNQVDNFDLIFGNDVDSRNNVLISDFVEYENDSNDSSRSEETANDSKTTSQKNGRSTGQNMNGTKRIENGTKRIEMEGRREITKEDLVIEKTIDKRVNHLDIKPVNIDSKKLDTSKAESLVPNRINFDLSRKYRSKRNKKQNHGISSKNHKDIFRTENFRKNLVTKVKIPDSITVLELTQKTHIPLAEISKKLMDIGVMASASQYVDFDAASIVCAEFGIEVKREIIVTQEDKLFNDFKDQEKDLKLRAPVVVVMGHVDHGKTSLLDYIRRANVIASESGGITQHIGAYMVNIDDREVTFLDTPGHEAFTAMRARGAKVTDIAILVVAADDGIMPQTVEAINHAKAAELGIIVAINKIDKEGADVQRIKESLTEYGLVTEEWGGDTVCIPISAKTGQNVEQLLEMVLLVADMKELKANPDRRAKGTVIESKLDKNRGAVVTVLVQNGTLRLGDTVVAGTTMGKIRAMVNDKAKSIRWAGPSWPVEILGLSESPESGDDFYVVTNDKIARSVIEKRKYQQKLDKNKNLKIVTLDNLFDQIKAGQTKELGIIIKADVQGSVEAIRQSLEKLSIEEVRVKVIHGAVGNITESDIVLALVSGAIIIGFNVRPSAAILESTKNQNVDIRLYNIIYNAINDVADAMKGMLEPQFEEIIAGHAEVRHVFKITGAGIIAGSYIQDGKLERNSQARLIRDGIQIYDGKIASLRIFKDDKKEVTAGYECGISLEKFQDIKIQDVIECYSKVKVN